MNESIEWTLRENGFFVSTTVGISMRPMLRNRRDRIILRRLSPGERLKKYDLPLYRYPDGKYILHRIIRVENDHYVTRGDNTYAKEHIPDAWVLGVVTEFYRGEKHHATTERGYRFYAAFWQGIYPVRFVFHQMRVLASRIKHRIFRSKQKKEN